MPLGSAFSAVRMSFMSPVRAASTVACERPSLRRDLDWLQVPGGSGFLVRDLRTGLRMRVGSAVRLLCGFFDGRRTAVEVSQLARPLLSEDVSLEGIQGLITTLAAAGILEDGASAGDPLANADNRRAVLVIRNMDAIFGKWERRLSWLLSWHVLVPTATVILGCALLVPSLLRLEILSGIRHLSFLQWSVVLAVEAVALIGHELAHAIVLRHHGGCVGNVAFGALRPWALATVDVSDIYQLQSKGKGSAVLLVGVLIHLLAASAIVLLSTVVHDGTWTSTLALTCCLQYGHAIITLIPWIESDGYYLLALHTGMPGLRRISSQVLVALIRGPAWERRAELDARSPAMTALCLLFALASRAWKVAAWVVVAYVAFLLLRGS